MSGTIPLARAWNKIKFKTNRKILQGMELSASAAFLRGMGGLRCVQGWRFQCIMDVRALPPRNSVELLKRQHPAEGGADRVGKRITASDKRTVMGRSRSACLLFKRAARARPWDMDCRGRGVHPDRVGIMASIRY